MRTRRPVYERVLDRVEITESGCWEFGGARNAGGYGVVGRGSRGEGNALTHRVTWEHANGPVAPGLDLDHLCRNRICCNPDHLEPVTRLENANRGLRAKGYGPRERPTCSRGHEYDVIRRTADGQFLQRRCNTCRRERGKAA